MTSVDPRPSRNLDPSRLWLTLNATIWIGGICLAIGTAVWYWRYEHDPRRSMPPCTLSLRLIRLALSNYRDVNRCYPPPCVRDKNGRALYSWRVLLLPYWEQLDAYRQYKLDEPWNSPHNLEVAAKVPPLFQCRDNTELADGETSYVMIAGRGEVPEGKAWATGSGRNVAADNTILVAEVVSLGIHWAEPRDLDVAEMSFKINDPVKKGIGSRHRVAGAHVLTLGGSIRFLPDSTDPAKVKALLTFDENKKDLIPP